MNMTILDDPVSALAIWVTLAFLLWILFDLLSRHLRLPHVALVTATLSWIVARLFLSLLPAIIHPMEHWLGA